MIPELELLYNRCMERSDMSRWFNDKKLIHEYEKNIHRLDVDSDELRKLLSGKELELFERFLVNQMDCFDMDQRMLFSQGVCIGLRLGSLCAWGRP